MWCVSCNHRRPGGARGAATLKITVVCTRPRRMNRNLLRAGIYCTVSRPPSTSPAAAGLGRQGRRRVRARSYDVSATLYRTKELGRQAHAGKQEQDTAAMKPQWMRSKACLAASCHQLESCLRLRCRFLGAPQRIPCTWHRVVALGPGALPADLLRRDISCTAATARTHRVCARAR